MSIQASINQGIGSAAAIAALSGIPQEKREISALKKNIATAEEAVKVATEAVPTTDYQEGIAGGTKTAAFNEMERVQDIHLEQLERLSRLDPSVENLKTVRKARAVYKQEPVAVFRADAEEVAYERALRESVKQQEFKKRKSEEFAKMFSEGGRWK